MPRSLTAESRFAILNSRDEILIERSQIGQFCEDEVTRYALDTMTLNKLAKASLINRPLDTGNITVSLNLAIQADDLDCLDQVNDMADQLNTISCYDLGHLLVDGHLSDVVLRVGDRKFPVHRAILAANSPVFRAMFTSDMKESVAEEIPIEDIEPDVMEELLRCVYTDQVPVECRYDMLIAFDRFGLISLLDRCQDRVTITAENALEMFAVAEESGANRLKIRILKFLKNREIQRALKN